MAQSSFPFENVDTNETQFSQMFRTLNAGVNGSPAGSELKVTAGTGLQVAVAAGQAMVRGHFYISTASENLTIGTANASNARIDSVVLRLDPTANSIVLAVVAGTPASTPVAPTLTQTDAGVYEYLLATVLVPAAATSVSTITDMRSFMGSRVGTWSTDSRPASPSTGQTGFNTTLGVLESYNGSDWKAWAPLRSTWFSKTGDYTLAAVDNQNVIRANASAAINITVPANVFVSGDRIDIVQQGTFDVTFVAGSGLTLYSKDSKVKLSSRYAGASLMFYSPTIAYLIGDLA